MDELEAPDRPSASDDAPVGDTSDGNSLAMMPCELQQELCEMAEKLSEIDVRLFEERPRSVMEGLVQPSLRLLGEVDLIVNKLRVWVESNHASELYRTASFGSLDDAVECGFTPATLEERVEARVHLADTTFAIEMMLRTEKSALAAVAIDHVPDGDFWILIDRASSALRTMLKSLAALERLVADMTGLEPRLRYASELESALEIRRSYADLWRHGGLISPPRRELKAFLKNFREALTLLVRSEIYPELPVMDRRRIRELETKLLGWMADPPNRLREGQRIWHDVVRFSLWLRRINSRELLVKHDAELISKMPLLLGSAPDPISEELFESLSSIYGSCDPVDRLIWKRSRDRGQWRDIASQLWVTTHGPLN